MDLLSCNMGFSKLLHEFVKIDSLIFRSCYIHAFVKIYALFSVSGFVKIYNMWIFLNCYIDLAKLTHGFVKVVLTM